MPGFLCDLHIHSCLSPCGDEEMTPYNLVNMAKVMGLDILALTDHNSSLNCPAAARAAEEAGIAFVPGMEMTTSEEVHVCACFRMSIPRSRFRTMLPSACRRLKIGSIFSASS